MVTGRGTTDARPGTMKTATLNVSGMTCGGCVANVTRALNSLVGVDLVDVSLAENTADVRFDEDRVSIGALHAALRSAGYDVASDPVKRRSGGGCCG